MRTLCTLLMILSLAALNAYPLMQINLGIDLPGTQTLRTPIDDEDSATKIGFSPSFEIMKPIEPAQNLGVGLGFEYQFPRGMDTEWKEGTYGFLPVYLKVNYAFDLQALVKPELILNVGYTLLMADDDFKGENDVDGGLCWAIGAGAFHESGFGGQLMYRNFFGVVSADDEDMDLTQSNLCLYLSYRF